MTVDTHSTFERSNLTESPARTRDEYEMRLLDRESPLKITLISLHGLIRAKDPELGRDADTGGQVKYVLELARELASTSQSSRSRIADAADHRSQGQRRLRTDARIDLRQRKNRTDSVWSPKRYLKKEALWPYIEMFVDQTLVHFRRNGLPDIIHGHYADAGLAGAQLARLLHIPFIFTGHSLGRVKRNDCHSAKRRRNC